MIVNEKTAKILLEKGRVIGVKTDTVFGFIVLKEFQHNLYKLKKRDKNKKLIQLRYDIPDGIDSKLKNKMMCNWPGPVTYVYEKEKRLISCRVPKDDILLSFLKRCHELCVLSSSANLSGQSPCITREEFVKRFPSVPLLKCDEKKCIAIPSAIFVYSREKFVKIRK